MWTGVERFMGRLEFGELTEEELLAYVKSNKDKVVEEEKVETISKDLAEKINSELSPEIKETSSESNLDMFANLNIDKETKEAAEALAYMYSINKAKEDAGKPQKKIQRPVKGQRTTFGMETPTNPRIVKKVGKNVYLIVSDCHFWYKTIGSQLNSVEEGYELFAKIEEIVDNDPTINNVIFGGDLYHMGFPDLDRSKPWRERFERLKDKLKARLGNIYAVIGNHEFTYAKNNLFWHLEDSVIKTPQTIIDNEVVIELDSFPSPKSNREFKKEIRADICITHNEVVPKQIQEYLRIEKGQKFYVTDMNMDYERFKVDRLYVAHCHTIVDDFVAIDRETNRKMYVKNIGSLGRTNINEIDNNFLDRELIKIKIRDEVGEDGYKYEEEVIPIKLKRYEEVVDIPKALASKQKRKESKEIKESIYGFSIEPPTEIVKNKYPGVMAKIVEGACMSTYPTVVSSRISELYEINLDL